MSSRTPEECVALAVDESATDAERADAIHALKLANECDELDDLVRSEDLDESVRRRALEALATPQCDSTLRELVGDGPLAESLRADAEDLLRDLEGG